MKTECALHNFGENLDYNKNRFKEEFTQGMLPVLSDELIEKFSNLMPTHIKIDVDGLESEIIDGAIKTLVNSKLKSILIELNTSILRDKKVVINLENNGFDCVSKMQPPECNGIDFQFLYNFAIKRK